MNTCISGNAGKKYEDAEERVEAVTKEDYDVESEEESGRERIVL